jgi:hypothetical protein
MRLTLAPLVLALAALAATASPAAASYHHCSIGDAGSYGTTYVTSIGVKHVTCRKGKRVIRAFHRCRHGARGRCHHRVLHFRCRENRSYGRGQFSSVVVCRKGTKRVRHTYLQFT